MTRSFEVQPADDFDPDEKRWETLVEQGRNLTEANWAIYGQSGTVVETQGSKSKRSANNTSRRGGRSFAEPSDSDLDPAWNPPYVKPDEPEVESIDTSSISPGRRALAAMFGEIEMRRAHKIAGGDIVRELAIARAHAERRTKQQL